ncbi:MULTISPECIES: DNA polymerase I [unclassified Facklamia]|uniref:DNA polymerase I n=1 Tax=Aerococcaceae TaxID=186827 RepID=UPI0013BE4668|nr:MULTISPECIES: DNA polymerase I [unclassified Facklamia]MBS4461671.1 DNA polymerase I [Aerococcaceae bacterium zg-B36]NEW63960.1 DNA polymerase I [Facklamia sp. 252]NEW67431.1 DNA polymerase I [Facklamia sp. 253]QQD65305.1 DNA polymerase I [Aerococcaceae bacterium zg-252]
MAKRKIMLIDGSSLAFRAFYSILDIEKFKNKAGLHTNALYSFHRMIDSVLEMFQPTHVLVAFDKAGPTFRTEKYADYKGGRQKTPPEFKEQMPYLRVFLDAYGIKHYEVAEYEADDIIGTLAHQADAQDEVIVISGDKDLIQLASDNTTVYITRKGVSDLEAYTPATIAEKYALTPEQIIDLKGLMGDSSDNYPGITRIGEKTALKLLHQFGSVEAMYERLDELKPSKMKDNIISDEANARMSKDLARILVEAPIEVRLEQIELREKNQETLIDYYRQMEFNSFLNQLEVEVPTEIVDEPTMHYAIEVLSEIGTEHLPNQTVIYFETLIENYHEAEIIRIAWADIEAEKVYIASAEQAFASKLFVDWLASPLATKVSWDYKRDRVLASRFNADFKEVTFDVAIAMYLVDPNQSQALESIAQSLSLKTGLQSDEMIYGKGAKLAVPEDEQVVNQHLVNKVMTLVAAVQPLTNQLEAVGAMELYHTIEMPLAQVLANMEIQGIAVDEEVLQSMDKTLSQRLVIMEQEIYQLAQREFNINSPKQLGEVLFDELGLPAIKKTKTGYSTAADVLEKLRYEHAIVEKILDYRQISKLKGTYVEGLPRYIHKDGKIHTRFVQTLTQTGRLSSADPNLQNIPIRLEEGRKIRQAFIPSQPGWQLFGADYSQIELRVLAHICGDEHLRQAFIDGEDIHSATARRVFGLSDTEEVDSQHRRQAKAVNFGIVYGISDYGLSQNLNITRKAAKTFIDRYFEKYPGVAQFMEDIVKEAKEQGYVSTLFNRRRYLPDIYSSNFNLRSFAERTAMNSPIQGTAADIIKVAMIRLDEALREEKLSAKLLLQVHDELILEAPEAELERLAELVPQVMEEAVALAVPLKVDYNSGINWYDIK